MLLSLLICVPARAEDGGPVPADDRVAIPTGTTIQGQPGMNDAPPREVRVSAFSIDRAEVSIAAFEAFTAAGGYADPAQWSDEGRAWLATHPEGAGARLRQAGRDSDHPVVAVTWYEADAYCRWRGGALPTEAQWERAACGEGERRFPWGDSEETVSVAWYTGGKLGHITTIRTVPVDAADDSEVGPFGLLHAAGNVWEWTADSYRADAWQEGETATDPVVSATSPWHTLRGGSYMNLPSYCTCAHREPARPDRVAFTTGFRCAYPAR